MHIERIELRVIYRTVTWWVIMPVYPTGIFVYTLQTKDSEDELC